MVRQIILMLTMVSILSASLHLKTSYYGKRLHGKLTVSGGRYNMYKLTCASKHYPFGTILKVRNVKDNKSVIVVVTDRGPYIRGRSLDLSYGAAKKIDITKYGVLITEVNVIKLGNGKVKA